MSKNDSVIIIEEVFKNPVVIPVIEISDESDSEDCEPLINGNRNKRKRCSDIEIIETVVAPKKGRQETNVCSRNAATNSKNNQSNRIVTRGSNSNLSVKINNPSQKYFIDTHGSKNIVNGESKPPSKKQEDVLKPIGNKIAIKPISSLSAKNGSALQSFGNSSTAFNRSYSFQFPERTDPVAFQNLPLKISSATATSFSVATSSNRIAMIPPSPKTLLQNDYSNFLRSLTAATENQSDKRRKVVNGMPVGVKKNDITYQDVTSSLKVLPLYNLRPIAIDGSNVAMLHGKGVMYSCLGIKLCVEYFIKRGHDVVKAFVPQFRRKQSSMVTGQAILEELAQGQQYVVFTPSRTISGKDVVCYDDRFILEYAVSSGAVIVSNDNYRDIRSEKTEWMKAVQERLLMFTFVDNLFLVPDDPLGRDGPTLNELLRF